MTINNKRLVGIHVDPHNKNSKVINRYKTILDYNGIPYIILDSNKPDFWEQVRELSLFIFHYYGTERQHRMANTIIPIIEEYLKIPCYPNTLMSWLYDDKVREYYFLTQHSLPSIPTWIFWDKKAALQWLKSAQLPVVFKLKSGASDENVVLVNSFLYGRRLINKMFGKGIVSGYVPGLKSRKWLDMWTSERIRQFLGKIRRTIQGEEINLYHQLHRDYVLFQKFLPDNKFDTRIAVIGKRAFGDVRYIRKSDFRASGSWNYSCNPENIDQRCIKIAFEISKRFGFSSMMYDFLFDENNQPSISEISYLQPDWRVWMYPGYWDENMDWHEGRNWLQYLILKDMLNMPHLKQPEMKPDIDSHYYPLEQR